MNTKDKMAAAPLTMHREGLQPVYVNSDTHEYLPGDVVCAADDKWRDLLTCVAWVYAWHDDDDGWVCKFWPVNSIAAGPLSRDDLPVTLRLLVRDGRVLPRETVTDIRQAAARAVWKLFMEARESTSESPEVQRLVGGCQVYAAVCGLGDGWTVGEIIGIVGVPADEREAVSSWAIAEEVIQ